jgi:hypothetical protein
LDEVDNTSIFKTGHKIRYRRSLLWLPSLRSCRPLQRAIAQRSSALALFCLAEPANECLVFRVNRK